MYAPAVCLALRDYFRLERKNLTVFSKEGVHHRESN